MKKERLYDIVRYAESRIVDMLGDGDRGLILVTRDSDGDCPVEIKAKIDESVQIIDPRITLSVVVCNREFESWFLAASGSFAEAHGCVSIPPEFDNADLVANAKATFEAQVVAPGNRYSETVDQPRFASLINFNTNPEVRSRSLRRFTDVLSAFHAD
jgi:hypothetical protein